MSVPVKFITVVLKKEFLEDYFPGGLGAFLRTYPEIPYDEHLVAVPFMSSQYVHEMVNMFTYIGADIDNGLAICCMSTGPWATCPDIEFVMDEAKPTFEQWSARHS
ncbi:MAG: hypothetical protein KF804_06230 [Burkholderiales bacterium]|nr:hypothetical protein [Burkholderiales bacterium]